ncbi:SDR family NAD(P)-dependent oxidoreductase [Pseudomonas silesiensis]|jgi:NAD(P)-dependent dehydrogenase (short-subunit alcohol dehydrogenase family)|uniref:2,5-dichloro-2,5-cyclohexadiene-1,4-diol dehydrogenase n=1 Tax=Pseudomonas silesiensis TaxID=1853130 RepID=A0A191YSD6_9PSED|nr:SDR family NAD(P)-dependent oxidoreductase [Pseudomonas silesiensis]ANJ55792.1 2,5-dichloro-2,5-cyclohexadiene-1,4-diol dehydrogenase [Pseudomonas silesiensis]VVO60187.1 Glucose 1-dehydrogenase 1 [Pseudomonas fluorescens]VVO81566.1 Glucose 1-dehydrogenase 1 [Pseudomonas fluorescens]VVP35138.1 Glucose 1-dehydrogenase 1 [Pseudomonas fluorescens]
MSKRLQGKIAFITGAGSGIGEATALRFAEEGATVVLCGRRIEPLQGVQEKIQALGGQAEIAVADVSDEQAYVGALQATAQRHGRLDILVNNAMAYTWGGIDTMTTADWHANFSTTVDGTFWGTRTAMQLMKEQGGGSIVNIASICGLFGTAWMAGYSAAKAAVINFSRAAASEGAPHNVRCNVIIPGVVDTPATAGMLGDAKARTNTEKVIPMKRVGLPVELANAILFLASDEASYVTGASLAVDGGRGSDLYVVLD